MKLGTVLLSVAAIILVASRAHAIDPTAQATVTNISVAGATSYSFKVFYSDDGAIDDSSIDSSDVRVTGPGGFDVPANLVSVTGNFRYSATYSITPPGGSWDSADNGTYTVVMQPNQVLDMLGNAVHAGSLGPFQVSVPASASGQLKNISTRLRVGTGDDVLIGGLIISGDAPKQLLLRALGPTLAQFGVANSLPDPALELRDSGGSLVATNDNWANASNAQSIPTDSRPPNAAESAILATLNPGSYTAIVSGVNGATGVALVEAYDLDTGTSRFTNISTRGSVGLNDNVMIAGVIVQSANENVVVRALGPTLTGFGVANALANPTLELRDANGALIQSNDDWRTTQEAEIITTGLAPPNNLESAIALTLPPGNYTAIVSGVNAGAGVALVEVYEH